MKKPVPASLFSSVAVLFLLCFGPPRFLVFTTFLFQQTSRNMTAYPIAYLIYRDGVQNGDGETSYFVIRLYGLF